MNEEIKEKNRIKMQLWRKKNPEKVKISTQKWRDKNKDKIRIKNKLFRINHPDRARKATQRWIENNREYVNKRNREWYAKNKNRINIERNKRYKINAVKNRMKIKAKRDSMKRKAVNLLGGKCVDCGYNRHLSALEFDHLENKQFGISNMLSTYNWELIKKELAKCELVCANCHRIRTDLRRNF